MKVAIPATGGSMSAQMSENFGRCAYFVIVDTDTMKFEPVSNPGSTMTGGAGPAAVREIAKRGAKVVLTPAVGPNAQQALDAAGIQVITGYSNMTVKEAVEKYLSENK